MNLLEYRYNVHSQNGEDGIIAKILAALPNLNKWCVEFGAWDGIYLSNTRHLIEDKEYHAILIEADPRSFKLLRQNTERFVNVTTINTFVGFSDHDRLDAVLLKSACPVDFDFLSIDVDGNDIHIWRAVNRYRPKVVCIEYNPTVPTEIVFEQPADSKIKHGCSLASLVQLGKIKGYELVCVNEANAFFVTCELFNLFEIDDNSPLALRETDAPRILVYSGYDGTILLSEDVMLPWHGVRIKANEMQALPSWLRKYPMDHNRIERIARRIYLNYRAEGSTGVLKAVVRWLVGEHASGMISYYRHVWWWRLPCGAPFNGQRIRQALFCKIVQSLRPGAIVETGTYLGATADFMAETGLPIYTIELNRKNSGFARARLRRRRNISLLSDDSRSGLRTLFDGPLNNVGDDAIFFYLDAHWNDDLPLDEEVDIIFSRCSSAVVMIDDFQVPDDQGYGYDDYGPGKTLTASYIGPTIRKHNLEIFYPSTPSTEEGGRRRGCIVLTKSVDFGAALMSLPLLRPSAIAVLAADTTRV